MMTLATIVIRARNEGKTLGKVLQAIQAQSEQDFHIVVVDSGSTDGTVQIARSYEAKILHIPQDSFSYGYALNAGLENSQGVFAVSLSGHSIPYDSDWLTSLLNEFDDPLVAGTSSLQIPHNFSHRPLTRTYHHFMYQSRVSRSAITQRFLFDNASSAIRMSVWRQIPFDGDLLACEDHDWARKVTKLGCRITYCPRSKVIHSHALPPLPRIRRALRETTALARIYLNSRDHQ